MPVNLPPLSAGDAIAVRYDADADIDSVLADAVARLRRDGLRVAGLLQSFGERLPNGKRSMAVEDLASGERLRLDLPRGAGASACTLDPDALARAASLLRQSLDARPDLVVVSRFGREEAEGRGLRAEIAEALCAGLPLLAAVRPSLKADWESFLGRPAHELPPTAEAIVAWARERIAAHAARHPRGQPAH